MRRAIFFDRDGVLNEPVVREGKPYPPASALEVEVTSGARAALERLAASGFMLFVVSNQPDVARGTQTEDAVREINRVLATELPLDAFYMCYHDDADRCECRKPLPGLLEQARGEHDIDLRASYMIGDRWRDIDAGAAAGCATILIDRGYDERRPNSRPQAVVRTIGDAAQAIFLLEEKGSPKA